MCKALFSTSCQRPTPQVVNRIVGNYDTIGPDWTDGALVAVIATVGHGCMWPQLRQWRERRSEPGYIKVIGGYKTDNRRAIKYSDGPTDEDVYLRGTSASSSEALGTLTSTFTAEAAGTVAPLTLWKRVKRWSHR